MYLVKKPDMIIIISKSEVELAFSIKSLFPKLNVNIVSMPRWEIFDAQDDAYKNEVLLPNVNKVSIEIGSTVSWSKYIGENSLSIRIDYFG